MRESPQDMSAPAGYDFPPTYGSTLEGRTSVVTMISQRHQQVHHIVGYIKTRALELFDDVVKATALQSVQRMLDLLQTGGGGEEFQDVTELKDAVCESVAFSLARGAPPGSESMKDSLTDESIKARLQRVTAEATTKKSGSSFRAYLNSLRSRKRKPK